MNDTNIKVEIVKDVYNEKTEIRKVTFQYKTDFNQLVIRTINIYTDLNGYELEEYLINSVLTYHCK